MPTTAQRQGKIQEKRTIYVSWLPGDSTSKPWVDAFCIKIEAQEPPSPPKLRRTDHVLAGERLNLSADEILADVTDVVAVLTGEYLKANKEGQRPTDREFARFVELIADDIADERHRRAWVAPLQKFRFDWVVIAGVRLAERKSWLLIDPRFALPPNDDEIFEAVVTLLDPDSVEMN